MESPKRRLTKEDRERLRDQCLTYDPTDISDTPLWYNVEVLLNDLDVADDETRQLRAMLRRLVWRYIDGDDLPWDDLREMGITDADGYPIEYEEDSGGDA